MLIYALVNGQGVKPNTRLQLDLPARADIGELKRRILSTHPGYEVRFIFCAGKPLNDDDASLEVYNVQKESTIQVNLRRRVVEDGADVDGADAAPAVAGDLLDLPKPSLQRQVTDEDVQFGDCVVVNVVAGRNLIAADWNGSSDPYVQLVYGKQQATTTVVSKDLNPTWNQHFAFVVEQPTLAEERDEGVQVTVWDHDYLSPDDPLGHFDLRIKDLPRDRPVQRFFTLEGVDSGEIMMNVVRTSITSQQFRQKVLELLAKSPRLKQSRMNRVGLTLDHLTGRTGFIPVSGDADADGTLVKGNAALEHLQSLARARKFQVSNQRTVAKVVRILKSQGALLTDDQPDVYLWFSDLRGVSESELYDLLVRGEPRAKSLYFPRRVFRPAAYVTFKNVDDALLGLLAARSVGLSCGFGRRIEPDSAMANAFATGLVDVAGPYPVKRDDFAERHGNPEWRSMWLVVGEGCGVGLEDDDEADDGDDDEVKAPDDDDDDDDEEETEDHGNDDDQPQDEATPRTAPYSLFAFEKLSDSAPSLTVQLSRDRCIVMRTGPWSMEVVDVEQSMSFFLRTSSTEALDDWLHVIQDARTGARDEEANVAARLERQKTLERVTFHCSECNETKPLCDMYKLDSMTECARMDDVSEDEDGDYAPRSRSNLPNRVPSRQPSDVEQVERLACRACLRARAWASISQHRSNELCHEFSVQDLRDLLMPREFAAYLDDTVKDLVASSNKFIHCPECDVAMEYALHSWSTKISSENVLKNKLGIDELPLSDDAKRHFVNFRFRCRSAKCDTEFCRLCRETPYHLGMNCEEYSEYKDAPRCRFCSRAVTSRYHYANPGDLDAFVQVCGSEECAEVAAKSCTHMLDCGHPCMGSRDEAVHPPCLVAGCDDSVYAVSTDECCVCRLDLCGGPIVQLDCAHVLHRECAERKISSGWSQAAISFQFLQCPLCNVRMQAPALQYSIAPLLKLEEEVKDLAVKRLKFEDLLESPEITEPESEFFEDPEGFAMHHFAFYQCHDCRKPYFAGARACGEGAGDVDRSALVCSSCQRVEGHDCDHDMSSLISKCTWCCSFATYSCFGGKGVFCDQCHSHPLLNQVCEMGSGKRKMEYEEYPQCPGLREKIDAVVSDNKRYKTREEKDEAIMRLSADPKRCPMGLRHPPNGVPFVIGCTMCDPSKQHAAVKVEDVPDDAWLEEVDGDEDEHKDEEEEVEVPEEPGAEAPGDDVDDKEDKSLMRYDGWHLKGLAMHVEGLLHVSPSVDTYVMGVTAEQRDSHGWQRSMLYAYGREQRRTLLQFDLDMFESIEFAHLSLFKTFDARQLYKPTTDKYRFELVNNEFDDDVTFNAAPDSLNIKFVEERIPPATMARHDVDVSEVVKAGLEHYRGRNERPVLAIQVHGVDDATWSRFSSQEDPNANRRPVLKILGLLREGYDGLIL